MCILGNKKHKEQKKKIKSSIISTVYCLMCPSGSHLCIYTKKYPFMVSAFIQEMEGGYEGRKGRCRAYAREMQA